MEIGNYQQDGGSRPGGRFRKVDALRPQQCGQRQQPGGPHPHDAFRQSGKHGHEGIAHALQGGTVDIQEIEDKQRRGHVMQVFYRHLHHAGVGGGGNEQGKAGPARQEHHSRKAQGGDEGDEGGLAHAGTDAVEAPRPQVLAGVGSNGVAEGHRRGLQQAVELVGGGKARDVEIAQAVEHLLHRHAAHGDHGILEGHGRGQL